MLANKKHKIFNMLEESAGFALKAAKSFKELVSGIISEEQIAAVKKVKQDANKHMHMIRDYLSEAFITPIDRDDVYKIAKKTDDITENIDSAAGKLRMMNISRATFKMRVMADYNVNACEKLARLISEMKNYKKKNKIGEKTAEINEIKEMGGKCFESAVRELFVKCDPIELIKMKEIYEGLKDILNSCEDAADCVQAILITKT